MAFVWNKSRERGRCEVPEEGKGETCTKNKLEDVNNKIKTAGT